MRTAVTTFGVASTTVTGTRVPSSVKTWVMPTFLPTIAATTASDLDLDVDPGGERVEALQGVDRLRRRLVDVDQPLVGADLEVLARVLVLERRLDHAVDVALGRQGHGPGHRGAGAGGRVDDLAGSAIDGVVVIRLQPDPDFVGGESCHSVISFLWAQKERCPKGEQRPRVVSVTYKRRAGQFGRPSYGRYSMISVTTPEPTVRPPSRIANRRPWSMAIG